MATDGRNLTFVQYAVVTALRAGSCVRAPNPERLEEGAKRYKKGWEIRFYAESTEHAEQLSEFLSRAGLSPGRTYQKRINRWIVPLYGRAAVAEVLNWNEQHQR